VSESPILNATTAKVSQTEVMAYVLDSFARADANGDGSLDAGELQQFLGLLSYPTQRAAMTAQEGWVVNSAIGEPFFIHGVQRV
jgi:hypothetical protein